VFLKVTYQESRRLLGPLALPSDLALYLPAGLEPEELDAVRSYHWIAEAEQAILIPATTNLGTADLLLLPAGARCLAGLGRLVTGSLPGAGQCMLPARLAAQGSPAAAPGGRLTVVPSRGPGQNRTWTPPLEAEISGLYEPAAEWPAATVLVLSPDGLRAAGAPNLVFLWLFHPEDSERRVAAWLENALTPPEVEAFYLAQRADLPLVLRQSTAVAWGQALQRAIYFPTGEAMFLLYVFFGVGVFTLMLLGFMDRRRELAVMKTLGLTSPQVGVILYLEVALIGMAGLAGGTAVSAGLLALVRRAAGSEFRLSPLVVASGALFSALSLLGSVWFPIGLARLATVSSLLGGQPVRPLGGQPRGGVQAGGRASPDASRPVGPGRPSAGV
jgi:hypothetical protein